MPRRFSDDATYLLHSLLFSHNSFIYRKDNYPLIRIKHREREEDVLIALHFNHGLFGIEIN